MNTSLNAFLLILPPLLPLLLAFPALRARIVWPCHVALLPAVVLMAVPVGVSIELPWLLLGGGLRVDETGRLFLAMAVLLWGAAATLLQRTQGKTVNDRMTTFFMLTLAGNLGVVLATDLVVFFAFLVLMGYAFYGLLVASGDEETQRAARCYLVLLVLSDLLLFEALLIAAAMTEDLGFEAVRQAIAQSPSSSWYLVMVLTGFAARAAIWPLHFWLPPLLASSRPAVALLLGGVPIAIALLGIVRWLPLGEIASPKLGLIIQGMGIAAMLYAILAGVKRAQLIILPAYAVIFTTGVFVVFLGVGLNDSAVWHRYQHLTYFFIVSVGAGLALLTTAIGGLQGRRHSLAAPAKPVGDSGFWFDRCFDAVVRWAVQVGFATLPRWRAAWWAKTACLRETDTWQSVLDGSESYLRRWRYAITLFLLLGVVITLLVLFVGAEELF